jgi:hypothetical protein
VCDQEVRWLQLKIENLESELQQTKIVCGQKFRQFGFQICTLENRYKERDQIYVNQSDNAQSIARFYKMQEMQTNRVAELEQNLKITFQRF